MEPKNEIPLLKKVMQCSKWRISCENFSKKIEKSNFEVKLGAAISLYDVTFAEGNVSQAIVNTHRKFGDN